MKQVKVKNRIDQLIIKLESDFSQIPNFGLLINDEKEKKLFSFIIKKISERYDYKNLYQKYYIPATHKAITETKMEINTSTFRKLIKITPTELKENLFETIRLAYVGLFHKIENYNKDLIRETEIFLFDEEYPEETVDVEEFAEKTYGFKFFQWQNGLVIFKINWICNCVKHYNSFPLKEPKPSVVEHLAINEKLKISKDELISDFEYVMNVYYLLMLQKTLLLGIVAKHFNEFNNIHVDVNTESGKNLIKNLVFP